MVYWLSYSNSLYAFSLTLYMTVNALVFQMLFFMKSWFDVHVCTVQDCISCYAVTIERLFVYYPFIVRIAVQE